MKSKDLTSAKQVLRKVKPQSACTMSLADSLCKINPKKTLNDVKHITRRAEEVYKALIDEGFGSYLPELQR